uniref:Transmembrane protein n=1 Tax=Tanacetum cinerariifolium TaxID=118510 RepID=A0A6L2M681_TANCI|nr:hypothetical protein [Tanacetum cinerariifolium]
MSFEASWCKIDTSSLAQRMVVWFCRPKREKEGRNERDLLERIILVHDKLSLIFCCSNAYLIGVFIMASCFGYSRNLLKKQYENFTDENEDLGENASKHERISDIDVDEGITLVSTHDDAEMFDENVVDKEVDATQV